MPVKRFTHNGMTKTVSEWAAITGISKDTLRFRIKANWPVERMLTDKPLAIGNRRHKPVAKTEPVPALFLPLETLKQQHRLTERQVKRSLREFIRHTEKKMALIGRELAKSFAGQLDIDAIIKHHNEGIQRAAGPGVHLDQGKAWSDQSPPDALGRA